MTQQPAHPAADEQTPRPVREGDGQPTSQERGAHTHHKKSPGTRLHQGG